MAEHAPIAGGTVTVARALAEIVSSISPTNLPKEVVEETKRRVLDAIGCAYAGLSSGPSQIVTKVARGMGGTPEATLWGTNFKTSCDRATLANSTSLRALDYMDSHAGADACHPCFNIPPCVAVGERVNATGMDVIAAIVAGYEVQIRMQEACIVGTRGWFSGMYLAFSVPYSVGMLMRLSQDEMAHAAAISISHGNTLGAQSLGEISASKSIADGTVSSIAVMSTLLAQHGLTGPLDIVESASGFALSVAERLDRGSLLSPLKDNKIMEVNTKWFNTVRIAQTAVAGAFDILDKHTLHWRNLEALTVFLPNGEYSRHVGIWDGPSRLRPKNRDSANHSPIYSLAVALVDRELGPAQYDEAKLNDPDVHSVIDRIRLQPDSDLDPYWPAASITRVAIKTKDGRYFETTTPYPPGHHKNRVSDAQMEQKFRRLSGTQIDVARQDRIISAVSRLDELTSINDLTTLLAGTE